MENNYNGFSIFAGDYGKTDHIIKLAGDINEDGTCMIDDLLIFADEWLGN